MKALFLDIDGVLQPVGRQSRFEHRDEIPAICAQLNQRKHTDFDYVEYIHESASDANACDIGAVYFDWDEPSMERLRRILDTTGARVILSSDWRAGGLKRMRGLMAIHHLDGYLDDATYCVPRTELDAPDYNQKSSAWDQIIKIIYARMRELYPTNPDKWDGGLDTRTCEIREYLDRHPEITAFVALDDRNLAKGLDGHFVYTRNMISEEDTQRSIEILNREDGPFPLDDSLRTAELQAWREKYVD